MNLPQLLSLCAVLSLFATSSGAPVLEVEQILSNGQGVAFSADRGFELPAGRHDLEIRFRTKGETPPGWLVEY